MTKNCLVSFVFIILLICKLNAELYAAVRVSHTESSTISVVHNINVMDFGAKGDAKTDDTKAFEKAIDSASKLGTKVFVQAGNYRITHMLIIPAGVALVGDGIGGTPLQTPSNGSVIRYEGVEFALKINGHNSSVCDLAFVDISKGLAKGGILIEANGRLCESNRITNVLLFGFTSGAALKLQAINSGGIAYCSFYDVLIRNAQVGIHISQDKSSFVNSNSFFHGAISGGGFNNGILIDGGNHNTFYNTVIEPPTSKYGHIVVHTGEIQAEKIRVEGTAQSPLVPLILFDADTRNSTVTGIYAGGLTLDKGNNSILLRSGKSMTFQNPIDNQFQNPTFSSDVTNKIPEWDIVGSGVGFKIQAPELTNVHYVLKITVPSKGSCYVGPTPSAMPSVKKSAMYTQVNFGCHIKTRLSNAVFALSNSPRGMVTSTPYSGSGKWEFVGMNALVDSLSSLDSKFLINNTSDSALVVYMTTPTLVFGNQNPSLDVPSLSSSGGKLYGLLTSSVSHAKVLSDGLLVLLRNANYFDVDNTPNIGRINHLPADRFPQGSVITLLFKNAGTVVVNSTFIQLKSDFTSVVNSSLTLISNGDGTWLEVQRNN